MSFAKYYHMVAAGGQGPVLQEALGRLVARVRTVDGCEGVDLLRELDGSDAFIVLERWASQDAHRLGAQTLGRDAFNDVMSALAKPPESKSLEILDT